MLIGKVQQLNLTDYPDKLACTVFLIGCNFRCPWCYSTEFILPEKKKELSFIPERNFFHFLKRQKGKLEGVVLGGGEPTIHPELLRFCKKIKQLGYQVKLDTNGSNPKMLKKLVEGKLIDYTAMDVKAPKEKYAKAIGFKGCTVNYFLDSMQQSINILKESRIDYEFRTTTIPDLEKEDIVKIAHWLKPAKKYVLQKFKPEKTIDPCFEKQKPYPDKFLLEIQKAVAPFFEICQVRNLS